MIKIPTIEKRPNDDRVCTFSFKAFDEAIAGKTISSAVVTGSPSGLTIGVPSLSGSSVQVEISGGTAGTKYTLTISTTWSGSPAAVIERQVYYETFA